MRERDVIVVYLKDNEGQLKVETRGLPTTVTTQLSRLYCMWSNHEITILC